jgi:hypothetical protein
MAQPIDGLIPPGGWHYWQGDVKLDGYSLENLYKVVQDFRAENHLSIGDVHGDVNSYLCGNFPRNCHGVDSVVVVSVDAPTRQNELLNDITVWAKNILLSQKPIKMVSDELAEARALTCMKCPRNAVWKQGCGSCITATERLTASIRQGRDTRSTKKLKGCASLRHDNRAAVFFDKEHFEVTNSVPQNCWLKI